MRLVKKLSVVFCVLLVLAGTVLAFVMQPVFPVRYAEIAIPTVDPKGLERHVRALSERFHPRSYDHPENLDAVVRYLSGHFEAAGGRVSLQTFTVEDRKYQNVVASFGPQGGPALIVGAHYDSYCENYREPELYTPGADDNASGVAGLLALAEIFKERVPARQVMLVAYCLEEPPHFGTLDMGSAAHAALVSSSKTEIIGMLSLEMIGSFSDAEGSQTYPADVMGLLYPRRGDFIAVVGRFQDIRLTRQVKSAMAGATELPVWSINAPPLIPGIDFSDHRNYWRFGHQAVMITDTAFYRNGAYHMAHDTADSLDYERMGRTVQSVYMAIVSLTGMKD